MSSIFVTGGAGFIGSALVRQLIAESDARVVNIDKLTYAGNLESLVGVLEHPRHHFARVDVCDASALRALFADHRPTAVIHLAAESHVDRSIDGAHAFVQTNLVGTYTLLQESLAYWRSLDDDGKAAFRLVHVSTDEVFGSLGDDARFVETTPYAPRSPYSATKAGSDHLVRAWHHTYGLPALVTNCSNNYGPYQFPEKLIPLAIHKALRGESIPMYGDGSNVRDWLYVEDHARALRLVCDRGAPGETYNVGGDSERKNIDVVRAICAILDRRYPRAGGGAYEEQISFVKDRPGHDFRYAIDASKIQGDLGWSPRETFSSGLEKTVEWYLSNGDWMRRVMDGSYRGERLGVSA